MILMVRILHNKFKFTNTSFLCLIAIASLFVCFISCQQEAPLFKKWNSSHTGIDFTNEVIEDEINHVLNFTNFYTGAGVGVADFNRDGLQDIFFGANMESSRLYLNRGDFKFDNVTKSAKVTTDRWITGVSVVDINRDGWPDIYLSVSGHGIDKSRKNILFINQGALTDQGEGLITFEENAELYGLADDAQNTHASFFDYDLDGDLDMFSIINPTDYKLHDVNSIKSKKLNGEAMSTDKLYRNNGDMTFTDVSSEAGILIEGYSLGMSVSDVNLDGWIDVYVTNDFLTNDILYINNQDGTFSDQASSMMKHTSFASMGIDIADMNNDGYSDIFVLDMFPEDNYREKMIMSADNYDRFEYMIKADYQAQYSRNTLQLNNGSNHFSEIGQFSGIQQTDWSWSALFSDFDHDGLKDLFITNGFSRDMGSLDYINYANANPFGDPESKLKEQLKKISEQPATSIPNYLFKNRGQLKFSNKAKEWGLDEPTVSHGAAYADLDNDGDMDLIVSNVSQEALVYENRSNQNVNTHYLQIQLIENEKHLKNGAKVYIYHSDKTQYVEQNVYRGYLSSVDERIHFGTGKSSIIDSINVIWSDGSMNRLVDVETDRLIEIAYEDATKIDYDYPKKEKSISFESLQLESIRDYSHEEDIQVDFYEQSLLPHQHSMQGPHISVADINDDDLEDFFIGGAAGYAAVLFMQQIDGSFKPNKFPYHADREDVGSLFFDADGDGDKDLYVVSGSVVNSDDHDIYQDRLYLNDGGEFRYVENALPEMNSSGSCVVAEDYDQDGDLDLFIGGRVTPGTYPKIPRSYLLENHKGLFKNITSERMSEVGMISTAIWTDFDVDGEQDLMLTGEFMPITIFLKKDGEFNDKIEIENSSGWWNDIAAGDFDHDGDEDYILANAGLNMRLKAGDTEPIRIYANDFDQNGSIDPIMTHFVNGIEHPVVSRDKIVNQIPAIKNRFQDYHSYASASFQDLFKSAEKEGMMILEADHFESSYIENIGQGKYELHALPLSIQLSTIQDILIQDINDDRHLDAILIGNNYSPDVSLGRIDAFRGAVMLGKGDGTFQIENGDDTGMIVAGDARCIVELKSADGESKYIVGNNKGPIEVFKKNKIHEAGLLTYE